MQSPQPLKLLRDQPGVNAACMAVKVAVSWGEISAIPAATTIAIPAAINPYSIAVAPWVDSEKRFKRLFNIHFAPISLTELCLKQSSTIPAYVPVGDVK